MPTSDSPILLQKINAQIIEFNHQGSLVAIGCKYGIVLIFDIISKEIVRYFNIYLDADLPEQEAEARLFEINIDSDQFVPYRKMNLAYNDDDFEYQSRPKKPDQMTNMTNQSA